jgi:hypothetical protein
VHRRGCQSLDDPKHALGIAMSRQSMAEQFQDRATRRKPAQMRGTLRVVAQVGNRAYL